MNLSMADLGVFFRTLSEQQADLLALNARMMEMRSELEGVRAEYEAYRTEMMGEKEEDNH